MKHFVNAGYTGSVTGYILEMFASGEEYGCDKQTSNKLFFDVENRRENRERADSN